MKFRLCTWCEKERVSHEWDYCCMTCVAASMKTINSPLMGAWSRSAKVEKDAHAKDILQPMKKDGTINKHFVQAHGTKSLQKELKLSKGEIHANLEKYG